MGEAGATLTDGPKHRVLLALLGVLVPVVAGAGATLALWHSPEPVVTQAVAVPTFSAPLADTRPQNLLQDGSVVVAWPLTGAPITLHLGQTIEVVLAPLAGESVQVVEPGVLTAVRVPACHAAAVCALADRPRWAFQAEVLGITHVHIDYGLRCRPMLCGNTPSTITVSVVR